ncbi:ABC transporter permease [Leptospira sp. 2 VSF19]|uniref:ABC transporter permease n=1 Tax=Leptospira soteropolitanensis TaxID=2950025 RepID=A0AAW5VJN9_9LEPT|nr:ABC transporter permease [Leptospira soteropolitanensis]MCW7494529.1 ABC transporter permease [Leptospira soteropolitanensis]MCW7502123.1 ABC transporter permease [Leptospira soteropolitanensis]MCW7524447.1 ABC transporter permease [Leptospira soteropolitanensis]MCW7528313.1 ABC transporter permease [Leptospira soteropolitanensis]MCW7532093.1 ABC transporter permease [Leptospira soteropolitanensis]
MKSEVFRFLYFLLLLSCISSFVSEFHTKDKSYLYADSGMTVTSTQEKDFIFSYFQFWESLIFESGGKTENGETVYSHIANRFFSTFHLAIFSLLFGSILAFLLSLAATYYRSGVFYDIVSFSSNLILSTPIFIVAILLLIVFFYRLEIFPPGGYEPGNTYYVVLPGIALGSRIYARMSLYLLPEIRKEAESKYVQLLQTRSYPWSHIVGKEIFLKVLPVALILLVLDFGSLLSGAMVVEEIFFFPGIGKTLYYSIKSMDTKLLATLLMYSGILFYVLNRIGFYLQRFFSGGI